MLAGATSMDLAMLVIAADDSVKQQTREHLDILRLLDLPSGVIALTKCDLADADWIDLVGEEIRELVADTFLADAAIVRTSATTGAGLDDLRDALGAAASRAAAFRAPLAEAPFRMAIDRTFTIAGHGTVVTGSVATGRAKVGETLMLEPMGREVRVRGLQNHDRTVDEIQRGQRAAINLAGVHHDEIERGCELAAPGHLTAARLITAGISLLPTARPLKDRTRVRVHIGTTETMASMRLLDCDLLKPGESGLAQLFLSEPVAATWSQPLVLRSESPVATIGGGRVLDPAAERIRRADDVVIGLLHDLQSTDESKRAGAAMFFAGLRGWQAPDLARTAGIADAAAAEDALRLGGSLQKLALPRGRTLLVHRAALERSFQHIARALAKLYEQHPLRNAFDRTSVASRLAWLGDAPLVDAILEKMQAAGQVKLTDKRVSLVGHGPQLSKGEQALLEQIVERYRAAGFQPPSAKEVQKDAVKNRDSVPQLIALAAAEGDLVEFDQDFYLHVDHERDMRKLLTEQINQRGGLTVADIRELLSTTRKYAVPLCEYLDRIAFTRRDGDLRVLAEK